MKTQRPCVGVDVGGTKIVAGLVNHRGRILERRKVPTPAAGAAVVCETIADVVFDVLDRAGLGRRDISGIALGFPGIVDPQQRQVIFAGNMKTAGFPFGLRLQKRFRVPVAMGNDVNLGLLGERWLGVGKNTRHLVGIFAGTGVGGGILLDGTLLTGARNAASEIGHMILDVNGPLCTCGNRGCLEAFVGRWAIERDIRRALRQGKKSIVTGLVGSNPRSIKSRVLKQALRKKDAVVSRIMKRVSLMLGLACVSLRHILDPEMIVLGGGILEACGPRMLPRIRAVVRSDPLSLPPLFLQDGTVSTRRRCRHPRRRRPPLATVTGPSGKGVSRARGPDPRFQETLIFRPRARSRSRAFSETRSLDSRKGLFVWQTIRIRSACGWTFTARTAPRWDVSRPSASFRIPARIITAFRSSADRRLISFPCVSRGFPRWKRAMHATARTSSLVNSGGPSRDRIISAETRW